MSNYDDRKGKLIGLLLPVLFMIANCSPPKYDVGLPQALPTYAILIPEAPRLTGLERIWPEGTMDWKPEYDYYPVVVNEGLYSAYGYTKVVKSYWCLIKGRWLGCTPGTKPSSVR